MRVVKAHSAGVICDSYVRHAALDGLSAPMVLDFYSNHVGGFGVGPYIDYQDIVPVLPPEERQLPSVNCRCLII